MNNLADYGKSLDLAAQIEAIKKISLEMDLEYAETAANQFISQAGWQDSASVLNPSYNHIKSDVLRVQGETLLSLVKFVNGLKKCQELKDKAAELDSQRSQIMKMFI